jgi:hypothetical protein
MSVTSPPGNKKDDPMDIDILINKVANLPIPDTEKADLLKRFKENMMNPSYGELENLTRIQNKYSPTNMIPPNHLLPPINPYYQQATMPQMQMPSLPGDLMTTAHFEVLRNKMDSIQLELVDLLRHVKDYTQRYMNATRQQDMEKIDSYINGLFEVDKKMKQAEEQVAAFTPEETSSEPQQSTVDRATSGIKNFLGSIGNGVASITNLVSNTAKIANDTLSKKVIGTNTSTENTNNKTKSENNKNVVSVDEYISSNMNAMETPSAPTTTIPNNSIYVSSNNLNSLESVNHPENKGTTSENRSPSEQEITAAINRLNSTMSANINNSNLNKEGQPEGQPEGQIGGNIKESRLTKKIRLLRLQLTKRNLEKQLKPKAKTHKLKKYKKQHNTHIYHNHHTLKK